MSVTRVDFRSASPDSRYLKAYSDIEGVLREWMTSLDLDNGAAWGDGELEEIECKARDGFSPFSHNRGGFDFTFQSDVYNCEGGGFGPNLPAIDSEVEGAYRDAKKWFIEQNADALKDVPEDDVTYSGLYDLGLSSLAEDLAEKEKAYMEKGVRWGVRAMYHGSKGGVHRLSLFASGNVSEYYSAFGNGSLTLGEWELTFKTASGLKRQLQRLKRKVEDVF